MPHAWPVALLPKRYRSVAAGAGATTLTLNSLRRKATWRRLMAGMTQLIYTFANDDSGAIAVDWAVLTAAALSMALGTAAVLNGGIDALVSRMDGELRDQQFSDGFVAFTSADFEALYENNLATPELAQSAFSNANALMNQEIIDGLETGILALEEGRLTSDDLVTLTALGSVARQRNILDDQILDYYLGTPTTPGRIQDLM